MYQRNTVIRSWCEKQLSYWMARRPNHASAIEKFERLNATEASVFLFRIEDGRVALLDKPAFYTREDIAQRSVFLIDRALSYRDFLQQVVKYRRPEGSGVLAMGMHDTPFASDSVPIFAFQKGSGSHAILLNDPDFITNTFYPSGPCSDPRPFDRKLNQAVFVGATTGAMHTEESVAGLWDQRLRSGVAFRDCPEVDFKLPVITQCQTEAAAARIRELGFGGGEYDWAYQFRYKFMISMDGNGATCARVALGLKGRSVLLKYDSPHELYYFSGLTPWLHYIPIESDQQVVDIVRLEAAQPGRFRYVSEESRRFYSRYLTRPAVMTYASRLIEMYFSTFT